MMRQPSHNSSVSSSASPRNRLNFFKKKPSLSGSVLSENTSGSSDKIFDPHSDRIPPSPFATSELELSRSQLNGLPSPDSFVGATHDADFLRLRELTRKIKKTPYADYKKVDAVWEVYKKYREECLQLCKMLVQKSWNHHRPSLDTIGPLDTRSSNSDSLSGSSLQNLMNEQWLGGLSEYKLVLDTFLESLKNALLTVYKSYEPKGTARQVEKFLADRSLRKDIIFKWRDESIHRMRSEKTLFWDEYRLRSSNYERLKQDVGVLEKIVSDPDNEGEQTLREVAIARNGDTVLDFANTGVSKYPTLRFRVSSHLLAAASPLFAQFLLPQEPGSSPPLDIIKLLPPPPTRHVCKDGMEVKVFQMPQLELNEHNSFTILLHAAHMHNEKIPREIHFPVFVSIAEVCLKYRCTSPLELQVEYQWLPKWLHMVGDDNVDGFLLIAYTFGLRRIFTQMSKTAILNAMDDEEIDSKVFWPQAVRDRIKATRAAKIAQIEERCMMGIKEYFKQPLPMTVRPASIGSLQLTSPTRCPRNSHHCDATNLGWLMLVYNELRILPSIMNIASETKPPKRSLQQLVHCLRLMPSAPQVHSGVCDYAAAFRSDISDIYNSVQGLTLRDVSGKNGWALSKHAGPSEDRNDDRVRNIAELEAPMDLPPRRQNKRIAAVSNEVIGLKILSYLDNMEDLSSAAMIDRSFYRAYKRNEASLLKNIMRAERKRTLSNPYNDVSSFSRPLKTEKGLPQLTHLAVPTGGKKQSRDPKYLASDKERFPSQNEPSLNDLYDASPPFSPVGRDDEMMSEEEAKKILWPDQDEEGDIFPPPRAPRRRTNGNGYEDEKSRAGEVAYIENKARMVDDDKNLREEKDKALGFGKHSKKGLSSGSKK